MKAFDVIKYICFGDILRPVSSMVDTFPFEHSEESLTGCIIATVSNSTHGTDKHVPFQEKLVIITAKLGGFNRSSQHF